MLTAATLAFAAHAGAAAAEVATRLYVCVEEVSAGWETPENGEEFVGKFKPDTVPMIVKHFTAGVRDGRLFELPKIEVTEAGKTSTLTLDVCGGLLNRLIAAQVDGGAGPDAIIDWCKSIADQATAAFQAYGTDDHRVSFSRNPAEGETPIRYTESFLFGVVGAYVNRGTCVLAQ